jgi:hypothetical protein
MLVHHDEEYFAESGKSERIVLKPAFVLKTDKYIRSIAYKPAADIPFSITLFVG